MLLHEAVFILEAQRDEKQDTRQNAHQVTRVREAALHSMHQKVTRLLTHTNSQATCNHLLD